MDFSRPAGCSLTSGYTRVTHDLTPLSAVTPFFHPGDSGLRPAREWPEDCESFPTPARLTIDRMFEGCGVRAVAESPIMFGTLPHRPGLTGRGAGFSRPLAAESFGQPSRVGIRGARYYPTGAHSLADTLTVPRQPFRRVRFLSRHCRRMGEERGALRRLMS